MAESVRERLVRLRAGGASVLTACDDPAIGVMSEIPQAHHCLCPFPPLPLPPATHQGPSIICGAPS